ncbi:NAD(P)-dependent dehydrogenase (short-subunit alcohol dehydrogenase family) [Kribbella voronezhensis]|uniref:NAD(P)-dependent dehydrogenase (Short-subunit alcohol dehydrogenase family) n=1 Tax=Kribbella voronezhensis TaxID=2512212 RepID=A0A4R7STT4_9ACTN|nr:SDR family oxidoreductase [Kribbella voronezhensis]TDU82215.1 NAD(P)-dependent dehydrogenase (short-subunit alcohol dehydrogenase family) [Kribbella voronezhensis]
MRLAGRNALVTGATSNIGKAIATAFAAEGAHVIVAGRNKQRGDEVVGEIRTAGGRADFVAVDLDGSKAAANALAEEATRLLGGRIDILVNNAGAIDGTPTAETDEETFDLVYQVNVKSPYFLMAAVAPAMARARGGAVINLGSWVARLGIPVGAAYAASKGALETLTRAWSAEFGPAGVRVNAISPGVVYADPAPDQPGASMMTGTPHGGIGTPDAIANAAVFLAGDESAFIHAATLDVDGGRTGAAVIAG